MGLFKSEEEKEEENQLKMKKILEKFELQNLPEEYSNAIRSINYELAGSGLSEFGNLLSPDHNTSLRIQNQFLNSIVQQNWIIIRQLNQIYEKLDQNNNLNIEKKNTSKDFKNSIKNFGNT